MSVVYKKVCTLQCDTCNDPIDYEDEGFFPYFDTPTLAVEGAREIAGWDCTDGKHYCSDCGIPIEEDVT